MPGPSDAGAAGGIRVEWGRVTGDATRRDVAWELIRGLLPDPTARITNECPRCGLPHGPVQVHTPGVQASVSYAGGFAIACVVAGARAASVGIDAELENDERRDAAGLTGIVRPGAISSVRGWTRIEAVLKADGRGLRVDPAAVTITEKTPREWVAAVDGSPRRFDGWDVTGPPGVVVSLAVEPVSAAAGRAAPDDRATP